MRFKAAAAEFISNDLRLRTLPVAVKFLSDKSGFPEKTPTAFRDPGAKR